MPPALLGILRVAGTEELHAARPRSRIFNGLLSQERRFGTPNYQAFFDELEARWVDIEGARPHSGKHFSDYSRLPALYPRMADILAVREVWVPGRVFLNDWLERDVFALP